MARRAGTGANLLSPLDAPLTGKSFVAKSPSGRSAVCGKLAMTAKVDEASLRAAAVVITALRPGSNQERERGVAVVVGATSVGAEQEDLAKPVSPAMPVLGQVVDWDKVCTPLATDLARIHTTRWAGRADRVERVLSSIPAAKLRRGHEADNDDDALNGAKDDFERHFDQLELLRSSLHDTPRLQNVGIRSPLVDASCDSEGNVGNIHQKLRLPQFHVRSRRS